MKMILYILLWLEEIYVYIPRSFVISSLLLFTFICSVLGKIVVSVLIFFEFGLSDENGCINITVVRRQVLTYSDFCLQHRLQHRHDCNDLVVSFFVALCPMKFHQMKPVCPTLHK